MNRLFFLILILGAVSACSPYAYQKEIDGFATSVMALTSATEQMRADLATEPDKLAQRALAVSGARADQDNRLCELTKRSASDPRSPEGLCRIKVGDTWYAPDKGDLETIEKLKVFRPLGAYASALSAVTNAEDSKEFGAAASELAERVGALVAVPAGAPAGKAANAFLDIVAFGVRISFEQSRLRQLRKSVNAVEPHMQKVMEDFGDGLEAIRKNRVAALHRRMGVIAEAFNGATNAATRKEYAAELLALPKSIRALQTTDASALATKMAAAHTALAKALNESRPSLNDVVAELSEFADLAIAFKDAVKGQGGA